MKKTHRQRPGIIFDLDGTLLDTIDDISDAVNAALTRLGFPTHGIATYKRIVGEGVDVLASRALPEDRRDQETIVRLMLLIREEFANFWDQKTKPFPGIPEVLTELACQRIPMAVFSNKPDEFTNKCVRKWLARWNFDPIWGQDPDRPRKPDPTAALAIAKQWGVPPKHCFFVGDSDVDMKTAAAAKMQAVGVLWGFRSEEELRVHGANVILTEPRELIKLVS